jgi:two-component system, NtrC family, nitrogen regulation sensor histidine kinase NtrY
MGYNRFIRNIILLSVLLAVTGSFFVWTLIQNYLVITKFTSALLWLLQIIFLIHYLTRTNRGLTKFLQSVKYLDNSKSISGYEKSFDALNLTYNEILDSVLKVNNEKEAEHHYFKYTLEHLDVGVISYNDSGDIELFNRAARRLTGCESAGKIKELDSSIPNLSELFPSLKEGHSKVIKVVTENEILKLSVRKTVFKINDKNINLVSLQNIRTELEEEEIEVFKKLISVLTHEIMNSVSPIKSLTNTVITMYDKEIIPGEKKNQDIILALKTIQKRSKGLLKFVEVYRNLAKIPMPVFSEIGLNNMFSDIQILMNSQIKTHGISCSVSVIPEDIKLFADEKLLTQMIINLIKNSIESIKNPGGKIQINAFYSPNNEIIIQITDNGEGIPDNLIDKIFVPFFTTKENGSGIGLSLSRQIMKLHGGVIDVRSKSGTETVFSLKF